MTSKAKMNRRILFTGLSLHVSIVATMGLFYLIYNAPSIEDAKSLLNYMVFSVSAMVLLSYMLGSLYMKLVAQELQYRLTRCKETLIDANEFILLQRERMREAYDFIKLVQGLKKRKDVING